MRKLQLKKGGCLVAYHKIFQDWLADVVIELAPPSSSLSGYYLPG